MSGIIGNTPLIKIKYRCNNKEDYIYAKLEYYNLTGSIKDRVVYHILQKAKAENMLSAGMPLVEATSGNTGISLSAFGALLKHPVYIFMPNWVSEERINLMKLYGAHVILVSKADGGFKKCIELALEFSKKNNGFLLNQFDNLYNIEAHYLTTGQEIVEKIIPDAFVSGIGTGGTLMGISKRLKKENNNVNVFALEPENMSLIKGNIIGSHKIEGIGDDFIPNIVDLNLIDDVILVSDSEALSMSRKLSKELGLGVGISSGANLFSAIKIKNMGYDNVVTVFPDDSKKYLSTDLCSDNTCEINNIELISYEVV